MGLRKKLFAAILTAALCVGFCGSAFAAENGGKADPTFVNSIGFTYSDGKTNSTDADYKLLMINGSLISTAEIKNVGGMTYVPVKEICEAIAVQNYTETTTSVSFFFDGATVELWANNNIVSVAGNNFDLGYPVLYIGYKMYFPLIVSELDSPYGTITIEKETPFGFPVISIELPTTKRFISTMPENAFYAAAKEMFSAPYEVMRARYAGQAWFANLGISEFMEVKDTILTQLKKVNFVGKFSRYYYFQGEFALLFDRYTGDIYVAKTIGDKKFLSPIETADLAAIASKK